MVQLRFLNFLFRKKRRNNTYNPMPTSFLGSGNGSFKNGRANFGNSYFYYQKGKRGRKFFLFIPLAILAGGGFFFLGGAHRSIFVENNPWWSKISAFFAADPQADNERLLEERFPMPQKEDGRQDFLILGIRGKNDPDGGLLSDTIILISYSPADKKVALVSVPRDLYVDMPTILKSKVNEIYERGLGQKNSLSFTKNAFSRLTGIYIDNMIVFDFLAFQEIVDTLGGIDINLGQPFEEKSQWGYPFFLSAGSNHLNGETALYYVRSRYSSSDFDRARRQQQVILAIKEKINLLDLLTHPLKAASLISSLRNHFVTDFNISDTGGLFNLISRLNDTENQLIEKNITTENLLQENMENNIYVLLPKERQWTPFRDFFKNIFL